MLSGHVQDDALHLDVPATNTTAHSSSNRLDSNLIKCQIPPIQTRTLSFHPFVGHVNLTCSSAPACSRHRDLHSIISMQ